MLHESEASVQHHVSSANTRCSMGHVEALFAERAMIVQLYQHELKTSVSTEPGFGNMIARLRIELLQLMQYDEHLLRQLKDLDVSISALKDATQQELQRRNRCDSFTTTHSDAESINSDLSCPSLNPLTEHGSKWSNTQKGETDRLHAPLCDDTGERQAIKIGNRLVTPCARVLLWVGNSDFHNAPVNGENDGDSVKDQNYYSKHRSKTYGDLSVSKRRSSAKCHVTFEQHLLNHSLNCSATQTLLNIQHLKTRARSASDAAGRRKMWRTESSGTICGCDMEISRTTDHEFPFLYTSRFPPSWRPFSFMDSIDNYLMGNVTTRLKLQPRPRLHRQTKFSDSFDEHSVKMFLSEFRNNNELGGNKTATEDIVLTDVTGSVSVEPVTDDVVEVRDDDKHVTRACISDLQKSDSGYDDSFEESDKDSQTDAEITTITNTVNYTNNDSIGSKYCSLGGKTDFLNIDRVECQIGEIRNVDKRDQHRHGITAHEQVDSAENENFITIHDGMITCRIMSPNLERQISEQNDTLDDFEFLVITDGCASFRPRETVTKLDLEESYYIGTLFEENIRGTNESHTKCGDIDQTDHIGERNEYLCFDEETDFCTSISQLFQ